MLVGGCAVVDIIQAGICQTLYFSLHAPERNEFSMKYFRLDGQGRSHLTAASLVLACTFASLDFTPSRPKNS